MSVNQYSQALAVFPSLEAIGQAVDHLVFAGFPLGQIFLLGRDRACISQPLIPQSHLPEPGPVPHPATPAQTTLTTVPIKELLHQSKLETITSAGATLKQGILVGNFTGGVAGLLVGLGLLLVPGVGEAVLGASLLYVLSTVGCGSLAGGTLGAWVGQGLSDRRAKRYLAQVQQGDYLLLVRGSNAEIFRAEHILYLNGIKPASWE